MNWVMSTSEFCRIILQDDSNTFFQYLYYKTVKNLFIQRLPAPINRSVNDLKISHKSLHQTENLESTCELHNAQ